MASKYQNQRKMDEKIFCARGMGLSNKDLIPKFTNSNAYKNEKIYIV